MENQQNPFEQRMNQQISSSKKFQQLQPGQLLRIKNYSYYVAQPNHRDELLKLIIDARCKNNQFPLLRAFLQYKPNTVYQDNQKKHWQGHIYSFISNGLSVVCCDRSNNYEIVATSCGECCATSYKRSPGNNEYYNALCALHSTISALLPSEIKQKLLVKGLVCELGGCSSKETLKQRGIFRETVPLVFELSAKQGFKYIYSYVLNGRALKILKSFGMNVVAEVDLRNFQKGGEKPFAAIEEENRFASILWKEIV